MIGGGDGLNRWRQIKADELPSHSLCPSQGLPHVWKDYGFTDSICTHCHLLREGRSWRHDEHTKPGHEPTS